MKQEEKIWISKKEYDILKKENKELKEFNDELLNKMTLLFNRIDELEKEIKSQQKTIAIFRGEKLPKKNSSNSNIPPTKDLFRVDSRRSLRIKSNLKPGRQFGHPGHFLEVRLDPEQHIHLRPDQCDRCGRTLNNSNWILRDSRQLIDIPPYKPITYQYNRYETMCSCGCISQGKYPELLNAPIQYGSRLRSLISYMSVRQYIPFKRLTEMLQDCFGVKVSEGFIANSLLRSANKAQGIYEHIKEQLKVSDWVGSDETLIFVNGKKNTLWTWQNNNYTFLASTKSRHSMQVENLFYHGFPNAILSSDQYAVHLSTPAKGHQICWVHLLRKIQYLTEIQDHYWLKKIKAIYKKAVRLKKLNNAYRKNDNHTKELEKQLNQLLLRRLHQKTHPLITKFQKSLKKNRQNLLTFLYYHDVPPDNNSSEQTIRNAKVKMKISGGFKSLQHAYAIIRSVIDTASKNNCNVLNIIADIEMGKDIAFLRPE